MLELNVGDYVKLLILPQNLLNCIHIEEQDEMKSFIGQVAQIESIEGNYFWISYGFMTEDDEDAYCTGHSFSVTAECLEKIK